MKFGPIGLADILDALQEHGFDGARLVTGMDGTGKRISIPTGGEGESVVIEEAPADVAAYLDGDPPHFTVSVRGERPGAAQGETPSAAAPAGMPPVAVKGGSGRPYYTVYIRTSGGEFDPVGYYTVRFAVTVSKDAVLDAVRLAWWRAAGVPQRPLFDALLRAHLAARPGDERAAGYRDGLAAAYRLLTGVSEEGLREELEAATEEEGGWAPGSGRS